MTTASLTGGRRAAGDPPLERRDLTTRVLRNAVAAWFGVPPAKLAPLDRRTIDRIALRLEGRRLHFSVDSLTSVGSNSELSHPWAG